MTFTLPARPRTRLSRRLTPLAAAAALTAAAAGPARALDYVWFGGNGVWDDGANWSLLGVPGSGDRAIIGAGTVTLSFAQVVGELTMNGGTLSGADLTVLGSATLAGGSQTGAGTSQFDGDVLISGNGSRSLSGGRLMNTTATTTWSGNTGHGGNAIGMSGSATIRNTGTWNDSNAFDAELGSGSSGTKLFDNVGTYHKTGASTTSFYAGLSNSGHVDVAAGRLSLRGGGNHTGSYHVAAGATLAFNNNGVALLDHTTFSGTGTLLVDASGSSGTDVRTVGALSHAGLLQIDGGTLQVDDSLTVPTFTMTGGQLAGTGTLFVAGLTTLAGGNQTSAGTSQFDGDVLISGNGSRSLSGGRLMNTTATTTWSGNTGHGGNAIGMSGHATIRNTGTWNDSNAFDAELGSGSSGTKLFDNVGTYHKTGASTTSFYAGLSNSGHVDIAAGRLSLRAGGNHTGSYHVAAGATLAFNNNGVALLDHTTFSGTGTWLVDASGSSGTDVRTVGALSHAGLLQIDGGTLQVDDSLTVPTFTMTGGQLAGTGTLFVTGTTTLAGGAQTGGGTSQFDGDVLIAGNGSRSVGGGRLMNTTATTTWSGNTGHGGNAIGMSGHATIRNTGTWNDSNAFDAELGSGSSGTKLFDNVGTYHKTGASTTSFYAGLSNSGHVDVAAGRLSLRGGGNHTGSYHVAAGATLAFNNNGVALLDHTTFSGTGTLLVDASGSSGTDVRTVGALSHAGLLQIDGGTLQVDDSLTVPTFTMTGGQLAGTGTLFVTGLTTLAGGAQTSGGTSQFDGDVLIAGNGSRSVGGGRLMNTTATTTWGGNTGHGGNAIGMSGSATIRNTGTWNDSNAFDADLGSGSSGTKLFDNAGTYRKTGSSTTTVSAAFHNAGTLDVASGVFHVTHTSFTNTGWVQGNGTVRTASSGSLANAGVIAPGASVGTLTLDGDLAMAAGGSVEIELAGLADFDRLLITDDASFAGSLDVVSLGYVPVVGDSFIVIAFDERLAASTFAQVTWSGFGSGVAFEAIYNAHDVTLRVAAVPEPATWMLGLAGLAVVGRLVRRRLNAA